ncbi:hypothetical protein FHR90_001637 [Endobacter medicaginis]|uniref:Uncharacterized protein n=1 Tax=Endobacter medicaginis TaxID=1181271 RepID=A0A839UYV0_9PROT|nr:hypothetical protein [Endobacter medicaginis]
MGKPIPFFSWTEVQEAEPPAGVQGQRPCDRSQ